MPISELQKTFLQERFKPRTPKVSVLERLRRGEDYDPSASVNQLNPQKPGWLQNEELEQNPLERESNLPRQKYTLQNVANLAEPANALTQDVLQYRAQAAFLKNQAKQQAQSERNTELKNYLDKIDLGGGFIDKSGKLNINMGNFDTGSIGGNMSDARKRVLAAAKSQLGVPYSWGGGGGSSRSRHGATTGIGRGAGTKGFDCSGLTDYAFSAIGKKIGYTTLNQEPWAQAHGRRVSMNQLVPGDLVFGGASGNTHHVAIYWGNGKIIEAMQTGTNIHIVPMRSGQFGYHLNY